MRSGQPCAGETLTVIVNTFKRLDLLKNSVQHYSTCPFVSRIHVNWAESTTPPNVEKCQCCDTEVTFALPLETHNDSSLNTRFLPIPGVPYKLLLWEVSSIFQSVPMAHDIPYSSPDIPQSYGVCLR